MLARGSDGVTRGKFLYHLNVGHEARASEDAFQQIVAEDGIFRNLSFEGGLKTIDFVDPLAAKVPSSNRSWYTSETASA